MIFSKKNTLKYVGLVLAIISLILGCTVKIDGLTDQAIRAFGVLAATLFLQIFETFNLSISCLLSSALLFGFGCVDTISDAFSGYMNHVLYFTLASFGISAAFQKSVYSQKILGALIRSDKLTTKKITLIFMACAAALSSIMSNVAAVVIFIPYVEMYLSYFKDEADRKKTGRTMMIALVVAAMTGGMITPAGSSMNLIGIDLLEKYAGMTVRFVDWVKMGLPLAAIMVVISFFVITLIYKPAELDDNSRVKYITDLHEKKPATAKDIYIAVLILGTLFIWVLSSWVPAINITFVSLITLALMFLPDFPVLTWKEFQETNSWAAFFVAGNHITIASVVMATGLCDFLAEKIFASAGSMPTVAMVAFVAFVTFVFMAVIPSAPAVTSLLVPILIAFAQSSGIDVMLLFGACIVCVPCIYLFPLDAPLVVAFDRKAFTMFELPKATIWIQILMIGVVALWIPFIMGVMY